MNFATEKDLRKPVAKAPIRAKKLAANKTVLPSVPSIGEVKTSSVDIVAIARQERALREASRNLLQCTCVIQRWWRGRSTEKKVFIQFQSELERKLADIAKLMTVVPTFVAPPDVAFGILKQLVIIVKRLVVVRQQNEIFTPLIDFCRNILLPSLTQLDQPGKNIIINAKNTDWKSDLLIEFTYCSLFVLKSNVPKPQSAHMRSILARGVLALVGGDIPFKMKHAKDLSDAFDSFRKKLKSNHKCTFVRSALKKTYHYSSTPDVFLALREVIIKTAVPLEFSTAMKSTENEYNSTFGAVCEADLLVASVLTLLNWDTDFPRVIEILFVPMLIISLSQQFVRNVFFNMIPQSTFNSKQQPVIRLLLDTLIDCKSASIRFNADRYTCHANIRDAYWMLGNISAFSLYIIIPESQLEFGRNDAEDLLLRFLNTCTNWLLEYPVTDILTGRKGIVWAYSGSSMTAVALPDGLERQILSLLKSSVIHNLSDRFFSDVTFFSGGWDSVALSKDLEDIQSALSSNAYVMTKTALKNVEQENTWFTSKWARKLTSSLVESINAPFSSSSLVAAKGASKGSAGNNNGNGKKSSTLNLSAIGTLCRLWAILLTQASMATAESIPRKSLISLAFTGNMIEKLWAAFLISCDCDPDSLVKNCSIEQLFDDHGTAGNSIAILVCFVALFRAHLLALNDSELYEKGHPLPIHQVYRVIRCLKAILFRVLTESSRFLTETEASSSGSTTPDFRHTVKAAACRLIVAVLNDLYSRWARRPFSSSLLWEVATAEKLVKQGTSANGDDGNHAQLLVRRYMPWAIRFYDRLTLFRRILDEEKLSVQGSNDSIFGGGNRSQGFVVRIRRSRLVEDGINAFSKAKCRDLKDRLVVRYINDFGEEEMGIDSGGLFKDFINELGGRIFDPSYGLFSSTSTNLLYPNPTAPYLYGERELEDLYIFAGRLLGKALFENITLQPQFAHFFLAFMNGHYNFINLIDDLATLDAELYKNLMFLKTYEGNVEDLDLTFSVSDASLGTSSSIDLIPGGSNIAVTTSNKFRYIQLVAKYYLHDRLKLQAGCFFSGLNETISPSVLGMFCAPELQIVISGSQSEISLEDLRNNVRYAGGYVSFDVYMRRFWAVFEELSAEDRALLLRFVTSCERPPSLGFSGLHPPFTVQKVDCSDDSRLPTASTCFNILKLPTYSSQRVMKEKLLLAIRSKAGFDLS